MINNIEDAMQPWANFASLNQARAKDNPEKENEEEESFEEDADTTHDWKRGGFEEKQFTSENSVRLANEHSFARLLLSAITRQQILDLWSAINDPDEHDPSRNRYKILTGSEGIPVGEFRKSVAKKLEICERQDQKSKYFIDLIRQMVSAEVIDYQMNNYILPELKQLIEDNSIRMENLQEIKQEASDKKNQLQMTELKKESKKNHYELTELIEEATYVQEVNECLKKARKLEKSNHLSINHLIDIIKIAQSKINRIKGGNSSDKREELEQDLKIANDMETINYLVTYAKSLHAIDLLNTADLVLFLDKVTPYKESV